VLGLAYILPGYDMFIVQSDSMKPSFQAGDMIVSAPPNSLLGGPVETGSIIVF
jgi:signal peptidase I